MATTTTSAPTTNGPTSTPSPAHDDGGGTPTEGASTTPAADPSQPASSTGSHNVTAGAAHANGNGNGNGNGNASPTEKQSSVNNSDSLLLAVHEIEILSELDSSKFGHLKLLDDRCLRKRKVALKAIAYLERVLAGCNKEALEAKVVGGRKRKFDESNNNHHHSSSSSSSSESPAATAALLKLGHLHLLMEDYGKALSAYQKYRSRCPEAKKQVLFLYGLGLVYYHYNAFYWSQQAFQQALYLEPVFERANEIYIRLGVMAKINHDFAASLKYFGLAQKSSSGEECLLNSQEIRFHVAHLHEVNGKFPAAIDLYKTLLKEPGISNTLKADVQRQLGWIYYSVDSAGGTETVPRIQTAIQYLQKSIEIDSKSGQSLYLLGRCFASIGKVHEAFIAYRNSVDKSESNADTWCSIGVLYQQQNQPMDALQAYICAVQLEKQHTAAWTNLGILYESTAQLQDALTCYYNAISKQKAPSPNLHQRIKYLKAQLAGAPTPALPPVKPKTLPSVEEAWNLPVSNEMAGRQSGGGAKGNKANADSTSNDKRAKESATKTVGGLTQQQLHTLHYLQNQSHLHPQQHHHLQQLQQQFHLFKQQQLRQQQQMQAAQQQDNNSQAESAAGGGVANEADLLANLENKDLGSVSDKELEALLAQQDIGSFAESLLAEIQGEVPQEEGKTAEREEEVVKENTDLQINPLDIPTDLEVEDSSSSSQLEISSSLSAHEIVVRCQKWSKSRGKRFALTNPSEVPRPNPRPKYPSKDNLLPPTPSVYLDNKKDAFSPQLQEFCQQHPITVVRGIANALKLDLGLFATKALAETKPGQSIEILTQIKQNADENWDSMMSEQTWVAAATKSKSTIGKYAKYQTTSFQDQLKDEQEKPNSFNSSESETALREDRKKRRAQSSLQFALQVSLCDSRTWRAQLAELIKLPPWARVVSSGNMLSHLGFNITGMNTAQLKMKVPGARISGRQEENNFCAININVGPGDCEWFAIPCEYWEIVNSLCNKNGVQFFRGSWWPNMKDLSDEGVPVYRFLQRPGDMVWINSGCIYWVQALGWCNNIFWNVGPATPFQYKMSMEKFRWNCVQSVKSSVPMYLLSWNLARNIRMTNDVLYSAVKETLRHSLQKVVLVAEYMKKQNISVKNHGRKKGELAHFCAQCENEVFCYLFVRAEKQRHTVVCFECAYSFSQTLKTFVCLEEYSLKELVSVYDGFKLQAPTSSGATFVQPPPSPHHPMMLPQHLGVAAAGGAGHHHHSYPGGGSRMDMLPNC